MTIRCDGRRTPRCSGPGARGARTRPLSASVRRVGDEPADPRHRLQRLLAHGGVGQDRVHRREQVPDTVRRRRGRGRWGRHEEQRPGEHEQGPAAEGRGQPRVNYTSTPGRPRALIARDSWQAGPPERVLVVLDQGRVAVRQE
jgi:hypothetical protein